MPPHAPARPQSCGTESLISTVSKASSDASDVEVAVNKLVAAPFHTAVAYFLPSCCLLCFDPCYRTPEEARIVQNKILAQGVVKAAAEALSRTTSPDASKLHAPAFRLLEAYAPLDAAAAGRDGALAAAMASARAAGAAGRLVGNPALGLPCAAALAILIASPENAAAGDNNARLALAKEALELLKGEAELLAGFQAEESLLQVREKIKKGAVAACAACCCLLLLLATHTYRKHDPAPRRRLLAYDQRHTALQLKCHL